MTITAWPLDAKNGAPQYNGRTLRQTTNAPFLAGATSSRPLGALSGVRPGTPSNTVRASSTTWTCVALAGVVDAQNAVEAGPYAFASDAAVSGPVTAANASNPRVDIVYVQISDPAESDGSTVPGASILYLAGSPSATPSAPATPARSLVLAQITVPASGGGTPSVTWLAQTSVAAGGVVPVSSVARLLALPPYAGAYADLTATTDPTTYGTGLYRSNGSAWGPVAADSGWQPFPNASSVFPSVNNAGWRKVGPVVFLRGQINRNTGSMSNGDAFFTMNPGTRPAQDTYLNAVAGSNGPMRLKLTAQGRMQVDGPPANATSYVILDGLSYIADA
jgi:hypothetical protein